MKCAARGLVRHRLRSHYIWWSAGVFQGSPPCRRGPAPRGMNKAGPARAPPSSRSLRTHRLPVVGLAAFFAGASRRHGPRCAGRTGPLAHSGAQRRFANRAAVGCAAEGRHAAALAADREAVAIEGGGTTSATPLPGEPLGSANTGVAAAVPAAARLGPPHSSRRGRLEHPGHRFLKGTHPHDLHRPGLPGGAGGHQGAPEAQTACLRQPLR